MNHCLQYLNFITHQYYGLRRIYSTIAQNWRVEHFVPSSSYSFRLGVLNCSLQLQLRPQHQGTQSVRNCIASAIVATFVRNFPPHQSFWNLRNRNCNLKLWLWIRKWGKLKSEQWQELTLPRIWLSCLLSKQNYSIPLHLFMFITNTHLLKTVCFLSKLNTTKLISANFTGERKMQK